MIIPVDTKSGKYDIVIEHGLIDRASSFIDLNRNVLIVTDDGVPKEYSEKIALQCNRILFIIAKQFIQCRKNIVLVKIKYA